MKNVSDATTQPVRSGPQGVRISDTTTRGIRIQVESAYVPDRSNPKEGSYFFVYQVRITNVGGETAQLVSREWIITDAEGEVERVKGPGVVGETPVLHMGAKTAGHWLRLRLEGTKSNWDAIGARILIGKQTNHVTTAVGYASASSRTVHFGVGALTVIPSVVIHWPSGAKQTLTQVQADRTVNIREP